MTKINAEDLEKSIRYAITAHSKYPNVPENSTRKWDKKTPYSVHPIWCAMMLLTETTLPEKLREAGYQALLYHDVLEDTTAKLPEGLSSYVTNLVKDLTYRNSGAAMHEIWEKSKEVRLLKLYDGVSNLLDGIWMDKSKKIKKFEHVRKLADDVEKNFGELNIVKIAKGLTK